MNAHMAPCVKLEICIVDPRSKKAAGTRSLVNERVASTAPMRSALARAGALGELAPVRLAAPYSPSCLATMTFMISLVPAKIRATRASMNARVTSYSSM